ncbi:MAG TPA: hypothetical protein GX513_06430 [Firmicutes bacterium]|nr:hypothetical protein [Bacillota bacterium]
MHLQDALAAFKETPTPELLAVIRKEHGTQGFNLACKAAGITRGEGKRLLGLYDDTGSIKVLARREAGLRLSGRNWR